MTEIKEKPERVIRTTRKREKMTEVPYDLDLNAQEAEIWKSVMDSVPENWFNAANYNLLAQFCKHVVSSKKVDLLIAAEERKATLNVTAYNRLLRLRALETRTIDRLMRSMRLSQQSVYEPSVAKNKMKGVTTKNENLVDNPWHHNYEDEDGEGDEDSSEE